jgi:protein SCO1/2
MMRRRAAALATCALALGLASGCGAAEERAGWEAGGVVRGLDPEAGQIKIEHGDIEGLMPAMTMSFDVATPDLLEGIALGEYVEFHLVREEGGAFVIDAITWRQGGTGQAGISGGEAPRENPMPDVGQPAPDFALVDQRGEAVTLASLRGRPVLLDFVFTRCPGPCPVLTGIHHDVREALAPDARARVASVSVTLDPAFDTPEVLAEYVAARRLDAQGWSFVTGGVEEVEAVVHAYGIGAIRGPDGNLDHSLALFVIDADGRVAQRYLGLRHDPAEIRSAVEALLASR